MAQMPGLGKRITTAQRVVIAAARKEFGMHLIFNEPINALDKDFRVEFKNKCVKESKITVVLEILPSKFMELCYETVEDSNKYFYVRQDPQDSKLYVGSRYLQHNNHHRYDLTLKKPITISRKIYVIQLEWNSSNKIQVYLDGTPTVASSPAATMLKDCARLVPGEEFIGDTSKKMHGFIVYEAHHTSPKQMTLTELNHSYTLPPQYVIGAGGVVRFTGKCIMRESRTGEIRVLYGGQLAATLEGLQRNKDMTVVILFHFDKMAISLLGAPEPESPVVVPLTRSAADPTLKEITVSRNLQTHTVEIYTGLSSAV
ncbi:uncharacterized protein [Dermacentor andersoni]|uniref:uncharacterized protein isoform X2 n=1 Tax=Dermacentor andersoni TaxID=34620 RepID=UPI002416CC9D|nr:uncharacterized protein LOC126534672 isoform X2 [Dermacentor andersoni]